MVHLTIDGKQLEVADGTTVLRAAQSAGVHIPTLCDHPQLKPYGGCRLCLVEVKGARTLQPSCTLPVTEGMEVTTQSDKLAASRKFVLSMIFSERNHFCPFCQVSGGDCELQNSAYEQGMTHWMIQPNWNTYHVDASNPYFSYEANRCILCRRCVRTCQELVGNFTLGVEQRGAASVLVADLGVPLGESSCVSCGMCVQNCPTGAMMDRRSSYHGLTADTTAIKSVCSQCSVGCGIEAQVRDNNVIVINGDYESPVNNGVICKAGRWQSIEALDTNTAIEYPMVRKNGKLERVCWEEAIAYAADAISKTKANLAALASTHLTTEALFAFKSLFADGLGSNKVGSSEAGKYTSAQKALAAEKGAYESDLSALDTADCVITIGEDLINKHEVAGFFIKRNQPNGTSLICIDSDDSSYGNLPNSFIQVNKGTEKDLVAGIAAAMVKLGLKTCDCAACQTPDESVQSAAAAAGVDSSTILDAAYVIANAQSPAIVYGASVTSDPEAKTLKTIACLAEMTGAKLISVKGQASSVAAASFGLDKPVCTKDAKTAVYFLGDNQPCDELLASAKEVPYKVVISSYANAWANAADVVLPVANWAQESGHFVNMAGKIQWRQQLITSLDSVKTSTEIMSLLASKLNVAINPDWKTALTSSPASVEIA